MERDGVKSVTEILVSKRLSTHVVSTSDADDVALELVSEGVDGDLLGHTLLVEDAAV